MADVKTTLSTKSSFLELLTLLFIGLKLTEQIGWGWFWVLSPILIPIGIVALILVLAAIVQAVTK